MLNDIHAAVFGYKPENGVFWLKREVLTVSALRWRGFVMKAERPLLACKTATFAMQNGAYWPAKLP